jgi:hypothetical protein
MVTDFGQNRLDVALLVLEDHSAYHNENIYELIKRDPERGN